MALTTLLHNVILGLVTLWRNVTYVFAEKELILIKKIVTGQNLDKKVGY